MKQYFTTVLVLFTILQLESRLTIIMVLNLNLW